MHSLPVVNVGLSNVSFSFSFGHGMTRREKKSQQNQSKLYYFLCLQGESLARFQCFALSQSVTSPVTCQQAGLLTFPVRLVLPTFPFSALHCFLAICCLVPVTYDKAKHTNAHMVGLGTRQFSLGQIHCAATWVYNP